MRKTAARKMIVILCLILLIGMLASCSEGGPKTGNKPEADDSAAADSVNDASAIASNNEKAVGLAAQEYKNKYYPSAAGSLSDPTDSKVPDNSDDRILVKVSDAGAHSGFAYPSVTYRVDTGSWKVTAVEKETAADTTEEPAVTGEHSQIRLPREKRRTFFPPISRRPEKSP